MCLNVSSGLWVGFRSMRAVLRPFWKRLHVFAVYALGANQKRGVGVVLRPSKLPTSARD